MNVKEKMLLVQLLLEDIRSDWNINPEGRALKAKSLCEVIAKETNNEDFSLLADFCDTYITTSKKWGDWDGRFFRQPFPMGYEKMDKLHGLKPTYDNRSKEFKKIADEYIIDVEFVFSDLAIN